MTEDVYDTITSDLSLDEFRSLDALDDSGVTDEPAAEEALHVVDPFVDAEAFEVRRIVAHATETDRTHGLLTEFGEELVDESTMTAPEEHQATVDEVLTVTTEGEDPARIHEWADAEDARARNALVDDGLPQPRHGDEFLCRSCFTLRHSDLRAQPFVDVCRDCSGAAD